MGYGFGFDPPGEPDPGFRETLEPERTRCVFDGSALVATSGAYTLDLCVPGASLMTGGTTIVTVRTSHRRRGLLRMMMRSHIDEVHERGEPLAALWASESVIYGRFGYGLAAYMCQTDIDVPHAAFAAPVEANGSFRLLEPEEAQAELPGVYDRIWRERPGHFARSASWWKWRRTHDPRWDREGRSAFRYALYQEDGDARGYLQYRVKPGADPTGAPAGTLHVTELQGVDAHAREILWRYALDVDLIAKVSAWNMPPDDGLLWLLRDPRRALRTIKDSLWVRLVDLPRALEGRRYASHGSVVLGVEDEFCPWNQGTFELEGGPDGAKCVASSAEPEIRLRTTDLGALYLGGNRFQTLARAGRLKGTPEALRRADAMFTWDVAPWCPEIF